MLQIVSCSKEHHGKGEEHIVKCLKDKLFKGELKDDPECQAEVRDGIYNVFVLSLESGISSCLYSLYGNTLYLQVFRLVTENRVDIQTDTELYDECKRDLETSVCQSVLPGSGRGNTLLLTYYIISYFILIHKY